MMLSIVIILALLAGLTILMLLEYSQTEFAECQATRAGMRPLPARTTIHTETNQESEKTTNIDALKSTVLEGLNFITSNQKTVESTSQMPHELGEIRQDIVDAIKWQVGDMKEFTSAYEMSLMLDDPNVNMSNVAKRISSDPVLSNKILRAANSAYFGSRMAIDSINHALAVLGLINIKSILFFSMISKQSFHEEEHGNPIYRSLWNHSVLTARCAVYLADAFEGLNKGKLYTLGLLHDFGQFFMPRIVRKKQADRDFLIPFGERESIAGEEQLLGINHAVIGRIAFEGCGLSEQILRLIEIHHFPSFYSKGYLSMREEDKKYLTALYLANQIAKLFVDEEEKKLYAVQPLPASYHDLVSLQKVKNIFSDHRVLSEIVKTKTLTQSAVIP
jgi:HD-like signal output (HDOD) protein